MAQRCNLIILCLSFLVAACSIGANNGDTALVTGWYHVVDSGGGVARQLDRGSTYYLDPEPIVTASNFETLTAEHFPHTDTLWQVVVQLDKPGSAQFARATEALIGQDLIFVLDDTLFADRIRIQAQIPSGVTVISKKENFAQKDAEALIRRIAADGGGLQIKN